jgi:MoaA/NifB/PqqE/SkfB family radical SAM enzyme
MIPYKNLTRALNKAIRQPGYALNNLWHRLKASFAYHFLNGWSYGPETISLFLTYRCNLKCAMCGQWGECGAFKAFDSETLSQQLSLSEIETLVQDVRRFHPNFTLFGGEPMLYPDWLKVVAIIKRAGLRCNIVTNGTMIKRWAKEIVAIGLDEIIFSLDGTEEVHDQIRRVPGTFQRAITGFQELNRLKQETRRKKPLVNINCTLTENNYSQLDQIIHIAEELNASGLTFHHLLFLDRQTVESFIPAFEQIFHQVPVDWLGFVVDKPPAIDTEFLIAEIRRISHSRYKIPVSFYPNLTEAETRQWYTQFEFHSTSYQNRCLSLWATAYIFPDGSVRPYHTMNFTPGNIRQEPFSRLWNNPTYRQYRQYIKEHKCFAVCAKGCTEFFRY